MQQQPGTSAACSLSRPRSQTPVSALGTAATLVVVGYERAAPRAATPASSTSSSSSASSTSRRESPAPPPTTSPNGAPRSERPPPVAAKTKHRKTRWGGFFYFEIFCYYFLRRVFLPVFFQILNALCVFIERSEMLLYIMGVTLVIILAKLGRSKLFLKIGYQFCLPVKLRKCVGYPRIYRHDCA